MVVLNSKDHLERAKNCGNSLARRPPDQSALLGRHELMSYRTGCFLDVTNRADTIAGTILNGRRASALYCGGTKSRYKLGRNRSKTQFSAETGSPFDVSRLIKNDCASRFIGCIQCTLTSMHQPVFAVRFDQIIRYFF